MSGQEAISALVNLAVLVTGGAVIMAAFLFTALTVRAVCRAVDRIRAAHQRRAIQRSIGREMAKILEGMLWEAKRRGDESMSAAVRRVADERGLNIREEE